MSAFGCVSKAHGATVARTLDTSGYLNSIRNALLPMVAVYPDCPMGFLYGEEKHACSDDAKKTIQSHISLLLDRESRQAMMAQGNAIYIAFATGLLKVKRGTLLADFPAIEEYPTTEQSRRVGSAVRAGVTGMCGHGDRIRQKAWVSYFWKRGFEIDGCIFKDTDAF